MGKQVVNYDDLTPMPWGKYKGRELANVPDDYLIWVWDKYKNQYKDGTLWGSTLCLMAYIDDSFEDLPR